MSTLSSVLHAFQAFVLVYFAVLSLVYAVSALVGLWTIVVAAREPEPMALRDLLDRHYAKPISVLVPAYNEEDGIVDIVGSLLALRYSRFEVIVAVDGATDATLDRLVEAFDLTPLPTIYRRSVETRPVRRVLHSERWPQLVVVEKDNGGRADAINAALNVARFPLVCVVDGDSLLNPEALARASRLFVEDETVIAVGGALRLLNGATVENGAVVDVGAPRRWVERIQVLEYARSFFIARAAWSRIGSLMIISGAFGLFRRDAVVECGGWSRGLVADDMEMVVKLHRRFRELGQVYRIGFTPDPLCWTEVPSRIRDLRAQRCMWERGILEVLWRHRRMAGNPRYGRIGLLGIPYLWLFETGATVVEALGYVLVVVSAAFGLLDLRFALLFFALAMLFGILFSELGMTVQSLLLTGDHRARDRFELFVAAFVEYLGIRQLLVFSRLIALFQVRSRRGKYWRPASTRAGAEGAAGDETAGPIAGRPASGEVERATG